MEKNNNLKKEPKKIQIKVKLRTLIIVTIIIIILLASNVFAGMMGYGNIFFMIKNLVTTGTLEGKDEIFNDKEITISYATIEILKDVELQVNKLQIRENNSTLFIQYKDKREDKTNVTLELLDSNSKELCVKKANDGEMEMNIDRQVQETEKLSLVVKEDNEYVKTLTIDLQSREILVEGEENVSKISEIELRKYLGAFALLKNDMSADELVDVSYQLWGVEVEERYDAPGAYDFAQIIKEFWGRKQPQFKDYVVNVTGSLYKYNKESDIYSPTKDSSEYKKGVCLSVEDISYKDGIYTVKYIYGLISKEADIEAVKNTEYVLSTIKLEYNPDAKFAKFKVVEIVDSEMIDYSVKDSVIKDITDDKKEESNASKKNNNQSEGDKEIKNTEGFTNSGFKATDKFKSDLSAKENAYIALEKIGEEHFKTEEHGDYYTYEDDWGNKYDIKRIISAKSEFFTMSYDESGALFKVELKYKDNKDKEKKIDLAVIVLDNGECDVWAPFDNYTGTTSFTRFSGLYSEACDHNYVVQKADYSSGKNEHIKNLDDEHTIICEICGDEAAERHEFVEWNSINNNTAWTLWCTLCNRYVYTENYDEVLASGYPVKDSNKSGSYVIKNDKFKKGNTYKIWYFVNDSLESYKGQEVTCSADGNLTFTMDKAGNYSIGMIQDVKTNDTITSQNSIKLELKADGTVEVK